MDWTTQISGAHNRIAAHVVETPTVSVQSFGLAFPVELKLEHLQHAGSFKARGAFNTLMSNPVPEAGLVAASGGNHGAAVAFAARALGHNAKIYVPEIAGQTKIDLIRSTGADLEVVPGAYANALEAAQDWELQTGAMQIHAYDAPATVAGQGTLFAEWEEQGLDADTVLIAVGGGGLIGGALGWFENRRKVVAVEPATSCALKAALMAGKPTNVDVSGIAANALGARRIGDICFDLAHNARTPSVIVPDAAIEAAQHALWRDHRLLVEPAGATALAALMCGAYLPARGEKVAVLLCGGNIDPEPLSDPATQLDVSFTQGPESLAALVIAPYRTDMSETAVDKIFRALMERIVTGDLPAGEKLRQDHIARDYEVSHVPVREAFLRLEAKGLAKSVPHKGMRVTELEPTEIREVIEMRVALEVLALTHALPRHDDQTLAEVDAARVACDAARDMITWDRCNRRFHFALLVPCAMPRLLSSIEDLHITAARHLFAYWRDRWVSRPDSDHAALLEAVRAQDLTLACDILRRHLRRVS